jgi:hypothetical protein
LLGKPKNEWYDLINQQEKFLSRDGKAQAHPPVKHGYEADKKCYDQVELTDAPLQIFWPTRKLNPR